MSVPLNGLGTANFILPADNSRPPTSHLDTVQLNDRNDVVDVGSLGLGTALAVAYDLYNDNGFISYPMTATNMYNVSAHHPHPQFTGFLSISSLKNPSSLPYSRMIPVVESQPPQQQQQLHQQQYPVYSNAPMLNGASVSNNNNNNHSNTTNTNNNNTNNSGPHVNPSWTHPPQTTADPASYLIPISSGPQTPVKSVPINGDCSRSPTIPTAASTTTTTLNQSYNGYTTTTAANLNPILTTNNFVSRNSNMAPFVGSTISTTNPSNSQHSRPLVHSSGATVVTSLPADCILVSTNGITTAPHPQHLQTPIPATTMHTTSNHLPSTDTLPYGVTVYDSPSSTLPRLTMSCASILPLIPTDSTELSNSAMAQAKMVQSNSTSLDANTKSMPDSTSADDSLYELSEEEMREIDATLTGNADVMASRQWRHYIETNEWTRATCALMACLFTRDQMANSTVLGRGGSQRARLPSNLVAYVVTTIRRRFKQTAAAVRARMAQKCKDERRFGRSGTIPSMDGGSDYVPVAAVAVKSGSKKSRKRSTTSNAASSNSNNSTSIKHYKNGSLLDSSSTPIYQPAGSNDDGCSSATDSNQLPPISLSPIADPDSDCMNHLSMDDCNSLLGPYHQSYFGLEPSHLTVIPQTPINNSIELLQPSGCSISTTLSTSSSDQLSSG